MEFKEGSLHFSGTDAIHTTPLFKEISNTFTIEFWVKPKAAQHMEIRQSKTGIKGISGQRFVIGPGHGGDGNIAGMGVSVGTNGIIVWEHSTNYFPPLLVYKAAISNWIHVAIVYSNKTPTLYVNGKQVMTGLTSNKQQVHPSGVLGALEPYGYYAGNLRDVRIWDSAKSEEEITDFMVKQLTGNEKGLFAYWKLTEGTDVIFANMINPEKEDQSNYTLFENVSPRSASEQETGNFIFCTSICANYLPKAMVLARSIKKFHPDSKMVVCLVEEDIHPAAKEFEYFDEIILAKDLGIENFYSFMFRHNEIEASTAVKGSLFFYLLNSYKQHNKFIYLDPDIYVMDILSELSSILSNHSIVVTPHTLKPEHKDHTISIRGNEIQLLQKGTFNLGFLAISRDPNSEDFLSWWTDRLLQYCYDDTPDGLFTDQKWVNLAPCFFDVFILKHPGYNVAPWNYSKRTVHTSESGKFLVNNEALKFVHFSGLDSGANLYVTKLYVRDLSNPIYFIRSQYLNELSEMNEDTLKKIPWSYGHYLNNEKISRAARLNYRTNKNLQQTYQNPFLYSNKHFI